MKGRRISCCMIDDNEIDVLTTERLLKLAGVCDAPVHFGNGQSAFQFIYQRFHAGEDLPALILLDLNMPIWDGWDFLDAISELDLPAFVRLYIMSSSLDPQDIYRAQSYRVVKDFIVKPFRLATMTAILNATDSITHEPGDNIELPS